MAAIPRDFTDNVKNLSNPFQLQIRKEYNWLLGGQWKDQIKNDKIILKVLT